ncbi:MAG: hypothetical protein AB7M12_05610 [Hyphomonadaceae bacterium]
MSEGEVVDRLVEYINILLTGVSVFFAIVSTYIAALHFFIRKEAFIGRVGAYAFFLFIMALLVIVMNGAMQLHAGLIARLRELDAAGGLSAAGQAALANAKVSNKGFSLDGLVNIALLSGVGLTVLSMFVLTFLSPWEDEERRPRLEL